MIDLDKFGPGTVVFFLANPRIMICSFDENKKYITTMYEGVLKQITLLSACIEQYSSNFNNTYKDSCFRCFSDTGASLFFVSTSQKQYIKKVIY